MQSATPLNTIHLKNYVPMCLNQNPQPPALRLCGPVSSACQFNSKNNFKNQVQKEMSNSMTNYACSLMLTMQSATSKN